MGTSVHVLGCGDAFSSGGRLHACFYIKGRSEGVLLDCGATVLASLKRHHVSLDDIDTIIISHFHGDHYGGLPYFLLEAGIRKRGKPLTIVTPKGGQQRVAALLDLLYPETDSWKSLNLKFIYFDDSPLILDLLRICAYPVIHSAATMPHGLRIEIDGKIIAYSGDTGWTHTLTDIARDADLFICECNFYETTSETHLDYATFKAHDHLLAYKQILLTHMGDDMLSRLGDLNHQHAYEGMEIKL